MRLDLRGARLRECLGVRERSGICETIGELCKFVFSGICGLNRGLTCFGVRGRGLMGRSITGGDSVGINRFILGVNNGLPFPITYGGVFISWILRRVSNNASLIVSRVIDSTASGGAGIS